tara:strand:+ start:7717 stop:8148 length:432 start_codon:yes stop_codon:yes gene_type:complete
LGSESAKIASLTSPFNAFGKGSIFDYFNEHSGYWINIGCEANQGYSFIHQVETIQNVEYRKFIKFPVKYNFSSGNTKIIDYSYPARREGYNSAQRYDRLIENSYFKNSNLYKGERRVSIHKYNEILSLVESLISLNQFALIEN